MLLYMKTMPDLGICKPSFNFKKIKNKKFRSRKGNHTGPTF